jgi:hypothetical protein
LVILAVNNVLKTLKHKTKRTLLPPVNKAAAHWKSTYSDNKWLARGLRVVTFQTPSMSSTVIATAASETVDHIFNCLGSRNRKPHYGSGNMPPATPDCSSGEVRPLFDERGDWLCRYINKTNIPYSRKVWRTLKAINPSYEPIDWQLDFRSGYRWDTRVFYRDILSTQIPGVDIKVPWELSRFQHLSYLALEHRVSGAGICALEYVCQILDWIAVNPPMFGVNWNSVMDVSIRAANWVFWFGAIREWVDQQPWASMFYEIFLNSLYDHHRFMRDNLEWSGRLTTNHYLANISGLLILSSSTVEVFPQSKSARAFAVSELKKELVKQVYPDGTHFEASTCYHRLALELFFYPVLWEVLHHEVFDGSNGRRISEQIFGREFTDGLCRMFNAVLFLLKPNGRIPQIGDNDSGQLVRVYPRPVLDGRYILAIGSVFFSEPKFKIAELFRNDEDVIEMIVLFGESGAACWKRMKTHTLRDLGCMAFTNSGWYVIRNDTDYVIVSCGTNGQNGNGGHAHNDKLSFELVLGGKEIVVDPGTYVYTSRPELRNLFRSTAYHNTISIDGMEQNRFKGAFGMEDTARAECLHFDHAAEEALFEGKHNGFGSIQHRRLLVFNKARRVLRVKDQLVNVDTQEWSSNIHFHPDVRLDQQLVPKKWKKEEFLYSEEYGSAKKGTMLRGPVEAFELALREEGNAVQLILQ